MTSWLPSIVGTRGRRKSVFAAPTKPLNGNLSSSTPNAKLLRQMDGIIRCIISLGRPSGCGMPGSVAAAPLALLMEAATHHMQQCLLLQQNHAAAAQDVQDVPAWSFVDIGAGPGRMLLAAKLFGASSCAGIELCDLTHTFEACKIRLVKKGLLLPAAACSCSLHVADALQYSTSTALLGTAAAGPVMVSLIDEGMPLSVREHVYSCVAQDPRVNVVVTVNYKSRAGHLPAVLAQAGFQMVQEMPAPLMGGKCSTAGRIFVRTQPAQQLVRDQAQARQQQQLLGVLQQHTLAAAQQQQPQQSLQQQRQRQQQQQQVTDMPRRQRSARQQQRHQQQQQQQQHVADMPRRQRSGRQPAPRRYYQG